jgi:hypothetical protein
MKKAVYVCLLIVLLVGSFLSGRVFNQTVRVAQAEASVNEKAKGARVDTKWEYCAVSKAGYTGSSRGGTYWISYFKEPGVEIVEIEEKVSEQQGASIARAIARLGEEGWEMVGESDLPLKTGRFEAIYFKRQKP